jgi:hypothetical protein
MDASDYLRLLLPPPPAQVYLLDLAVHMIGDHLVGFSPPHSEGHIISREYHTSGSVYIIHFYFVFDRPPPPFYSRIYLLRIPFFSQYVCTPLCYLFGGLLVATSFLSEDHRSPHPPHSATSCSCCDKNGAIDL